MDKMRRIFSVLLVLGAMFWILPAGAQTQTEIEMAKRMARQQGYSEQQIEQMTGKQNQNRNAQNGVTQPIPQGVDRGEGLEMTEPDFAETDGLRKKSSEIFGHDIFKNENLNFVPSYNIPTPENYRLSAGDEVVIDVWGATVTNITTRITPEGSISIPDLGPVYINGQTVKQAEKNIREYLSKIYSGISDPTPNTFVKLALGKIRSVTVNVLGEVEKPGSYTLPSLSTVGSALYLAGGPTELGTVRKVKVFRNNRQVSEFDVYEFMQSGDFSSDIRLEDNDAIVVDPYVNVVSISGTVKRPMKYEMKPGETLDKLLRYAGGFSDKAFEGIVHVDRVRGTTLGESFDVEKNGFASFALEDGDRVTAYEVSDRLRNQVKIAGAVWRPGTYAISETSRSLKELIRDAGGLQEDAYLQKAYIVRYGENREEEQVSFSLEEVILGGRSIDLMPDDSVHIFSISSLKTKPTVSISGEVNAAVRDNGQTQKYSYRKGMTLGDLILMARGTSEAAALSRVEVARRISNPDYGHGSPLSKSSDTVATILHFNLLNRPSDADFPLEPFDAVFVRRAASYKPQQFIEVKGEVNYPGLYVIEKNTVRLSDVIGKANGFNGDAYVAGARLTRKLTDDEIAKLKIAKEIAQEQIADSTALKDLEIGDSFNIGIDLAAAMKNPGSYADVVLREGDIITIPKMNSTVRISGGVFYPNTIAYNTRFRFKDYVSNAGGYTQSAMRRKAYMVHMNGSVAQRGAKGFKVQPGTEIVIPEKDMQSRNRVTLSEVLGIASSTASIAAIVVSISNMVK